MQTVRYQPDYDMGRKNLKVRSRKGNLMKRVILFCAILSAAVVGGACGGRVDESLLPTPIATYDLTAQASGGSAPTAVSSEAEATAAPTATPQNAAAAQATPTLAATSEPAPTARLSNEPVTASELLTGSGEITATSELTTVTPPVSTTVSVTPATMVTTTVVITDTEPVTSAATITAVATLRPTSALTMTLTASEALTTSAPLSASDNLSTTAAVDPVLAGLPAPIVAALAHADPEHGQQLTLSNACIGCHNVNPAVQMTGPTWHNIANTAATRVPGESAGLYLYHSIIRPNQYVVPGYQPGIMIQTYQDMLSDQDLADIIAYLLTLKE